MKIQYEITEQILNSIVKYELCIQKSSAIPLPQKYLTKLYQKQKADEISHLSDMLGISIGYDKALDIQRGKETHISIDKHKILNNYRSTQEFIKSYTDRQFMPISFPLIAHLNTLLFKNVVEDWELGKSREFSQKPNPLFDNWTDLKEYYPTIDLSNHFDNLARLFYSKDNQIHQIVLSLIMMYEMIDKAPLVAANQLTAINLLSCILSNYKYNPNNLLPIGKVVAENEHSIITEFKKTRISKSMTGFIEIMADLLASESLALYNAIIFVYENSAQKKILLSVQYNDRQIKILEYLQIHKSISRNEYSKLMGVSFMTAFRDLSQLVEDDYLEIIGRGRGTRYELMVEPGEDKDKPVPTALFNDLE